MFLRIRSRWLERREPIVFSRWLSSLSKAEFDQFADAVLERLTNLGVLRASDLCVAIGESTPRMKRPGEPEPRSLLMHPVPRSRDEILVIAGHLAHRAASRLGKPTPEFSENAAVFLASRAWAIHDLADRIAQAVASNVGSLIIGTDLVDEPQAKCVTQHPCWSREQQDAADGVIRLLWRDFARRRRLGVSR